MLFRWLAAFVLCAWTSDVTADDGFGADSHTWDGLSGLVAIAAAEGHPLELPTQVDVSTLAAGDGLIVVHPTGELPVTAITAFLRRGGRVAIVDDRGSGDQLLSAFQIDRGDPGPALAKLRNNPALLIAQPAGGHPLTQEVRAVVTNHSTTLRHAQLEPVFTLDDDGALVLAGAVGRGRLIAIADSSLFINNMLELDGNRQLARNLMRYLHEEPSARLLLVVGSTPLTTTSVGGIAPSFDQWRSLMRRLATVQLPPHAIVLSGWILCGFAFLLAASQVPLRSPYARTTLFARAPTIAGFAGRVAHFRQHQRNLLQPSMAFKIEFEAELLQRLGADGLLLLGDVVDVLKRRGASAEQVSQVRLLLTSLDRIATAEERGGEPPMVSAATFRDLVATGERILADVGRRE